MQKLAEGFMKYEGEYFYEAQVSHLINFRPISSQFPVHFRFSLIPFPELFFQTTGTIQGCDGKRAKGTKRRGIHYKRKRFTRKMTKALFKIGRRKPITRKGQKELEKNNA